jgi:uncharacterized membrane protein YbaN (DUF454 family)
MPDPNEPRVGPAAALAYRALGAVAFALGVAGVVLPGLPATPFLLLAVWSFGRGAPEWAARIERHRQFGPLLRNWRERGVVPFPAKVLAAVWMGASFLVLWASGAPPLALASVALIACAVLAFLFSRPSR